MRFRYLFLIFFSLSAEAARFVPRLMSVADRKTALQILGFGSSSKLLTNPYPLGGYSGYEFGVASQYIPMDDLRSLGDKTSRGGELNYYNISISKGLFYNIDTSVFFTPGSQSEDLQSFGAQFRWGFYEFPFIPGGLTAVLHGSGTNFGSLMDTRTTGVDVVATVVVEDVALFFGAGQARTLGTFSGASVTNGKTESTTDACDPTTCQAAYEDMSQNHSFFGISLAFANLFASLQIDRYFQSTYAAKVGWRF